MSVVHLEVRAGFVHRQLEPKYFVMRLAPDDRYFRKGYRFAVQLLNDAGEGGAVLFLRGPSPEFRRGEICVPVEVIASAMRQNEGKGDYVDAHGGSRAPF
jgi:hypothetical protein